MLLSFSFPPLPARVLGWAGGVALRAPGGGGVGGGVPQADALARGSVLLIFAFAGIERALGPSGEVRDVARTVPRAIFLAMGAVTVVYLGLPLVGGGVMGGALAERAPPLAGAAAVALGPWGRTLILV